MTDPEGPPANSPTTTLSAAEAVNRGYNTLVVTVLLLAGLGFSELIFGEPDPADKIDNTLLLILGLVAVAWYFMGNHRVQRTPVPIVLGAVALGIQILGIGIEIGDPSAVGDDFGGLTIYLSALIAFVVLYSVNRRYVR